MTVEKQNKEKFQNLLEKLGIPYRSITLIGGIRLHIHIEAKCKTTAEKWASVLHKITNNKSVSLYESFAEYANWHPQDSCLIKHKHKIWKVYACV